MREAQKLRLVYWCYRFYRFNYNLLLRLFLYGIYCVRQFVCDYVLTIVFYYLLLRLFLYGIYCVSMYVTMSISTGLYPKLDLWKANKLHYITHHRKSA